MKKMWLFVSLVVPMMLAVAAPAKKVILTGFGGLTPAQLRAYGAEAEKAVPADGVMVRLSYPTTVNGKFFMMNHHSVFSGVKWKKEWMKKSLEDMKAAKLKQFTDNFLYIATSGCNFDLFDDKAWDTVFHNVKLMAEFARETGLKGFFWDVEYYEGGKRWPLFKFNPAGKHTFAECERQARKRGREFMNTIASVFPEAKIITVLGSYCINFPVLDSEKPREALKPQLYGLSPAFFDGMFDALPPEGRIYDGTELTGYLASTAFDYYRIGHDYLTKTVQLCAPELRNKILCQSGLAVPMYMECYTNKKGFWRFSSPHMDQVKLFRRNLYHALQASDEYCWFYDDGASKWYPFAMESFFEGVFARKGGGKAKFWSERLPGVINAIRAAKDPLGYARAQLAAGKGEVVFRADFEDGKLNVFQWLGDKKGKIKVDTAGGADGSKACVAMDGVTYGSIYCRASVKPGELYLMRVKVKNFRPECKITLSCKWGAKVQNCQSSYFKPGKDGWHQAEIVLFVPDEAKNLEMFCSVDTKNPEGADCRFDDMEIIRIP